MTLGQGLFFQKTSKEVEIFTDADQAGSTTDRRSTSGYCTYVWGNLVTWRSMKQSIVSCSSAEAEFKALAHGICEGIWLKRILYELGMPISRSLKVFCDNQSAISIAKNPVHHDRTKHMQIDRHLIKEKIESNTISLQYIPTSQQTADILTKVLPTKNSKILFPSQVYSTSSTQLEGSVEIWKEIQNLSPDFQRLGVEIQFPRIKGFGYHYT